VAPAGDVNADGFPDVVIGTMFMDDGAMDEGCAYVFHARDPDLPGSPATTFCNPANQADGHFGRSVASAGDVNGDGYADVIVGASGQDSGAADEGNVFVYYGSATGIPTSPSVTLDNPANQASGMFGYSVASAGDVNGDGFVDVIIGAPFQDNGASDEGNAFIYHGSAAGLATSPARTLDNPANQAGGQLGVSVASAGDVNGDGFADVVVGASEQDNGASNEGNVFVYHGSSTGIGDSPSRTLDNPANQADGAFGVSVSTAGDVNGDGYSDIVVGASRQANGATSEGNVFIYHGSATGIPASPARTLDNPDNQAGGMFGCSVAWAGDITGDGYADIIVGAYRQDNPSLDEGNAFIYHGSATGIPGTHNARLDPANQISARFGYSVASRDHVPGRDRRIWSIERPAACLPRRELGFLLALVEA
jgi:hypothetical protein